VAAATATTAAASAAGEATGRRGRAGAVACRGKYGKLDRSFFAGALGAGDLLLFVDDDFLEVFFAVFADVFVDGHKLSSSLYQLLGYGQFRWSASRATITSFCPSG
jgi:hypothetical protein